MRIKLMRPSSKMPVLKTDGAVGYDCFIDLGYGLNPATDTVPDNYYMQPGEKHKFGLGFASEVPASHAGLVLPRSGTGSDGIHLANVVAVIDRDYRGEWICNVHNTTKDQLRIKHGERYFQMVIVPVYTMPLEVVEELSETARGAGGFGSTGK